MYARWYSNQTEASIGCRGQDHRGAFAIRSNIFRGEALTPPIAVLKMAAMIDGWQVEDGD